MVWFYPIGDVMKNPIPVHKISIFAGSFIAALFLEVTIEAVIVLGVPQVWDSAAVGILLLAAILVDRYQTSGYSLRQTPAGALGGRLQRRQGHGTGAAR